MLKKTLSLTIVALLINLMTVNFAFAESNKKDAKFAEKVKSAVARLGVGEQARIEIKLRDKTKLKGYVKEAGDESFVVLDSKSGVETIVAYPNVKQVRGNNLSTGAKIAIGVGIGAGITLLILFLIATSDD